jgi:hypothetical protein
VKGRPPPRPGDVVGGGLSNVIPRTVGDTDGVVVPPPAGRLVVPPPAGGLVVPTPAGAVVVPTPAGGVVVPPPVGRLLAGQALLLGLTVENSVLAVNGTTTSVSAVEAGRGVADGVTTMVEGELASALALAAISSADAPHARPAHTANAAIVRRLGSSLKAPRMTLVIAHNPDRGCEEAVKRAGASRSRRRHNSLHRGAAQCRLSHTAIGRV